jgi:hypothetical protein
MMIPLKGHRNASIDHENVDKWRSGSKRPVLLAVRRRIVLDMPVGAPPAFPQGSLCRAKPLDFWLPAWRGTGCLGALSNGV